MARMPDDGGGLGSLFSFVVDLLVPEWEGPRRRTRESRRARRSRRRLTRATLPPDETLTLRTSTRSERAVYLLRVVPDRCPLRPGPSVGRLLARSSKGWNVVVLRAHGDGFGRWQVAHVEAVPGDGDPAPVWRALRADICAGRFETPA